jgi:hypothetical protein
MFVAPFEPSAIGWSQSIAIGRTVAAANQA